MKWFIIALSLVSQVSFAQVVSPSRGLEVLEALDLAMIERDLTCVQTYANGRKGGEFPASLLTLKELFKAAKVDVDERGLVVTASQTTDVSKTYLLVYLSDAKTVTSMTIEMMDRNIKRENVGSITNPEIRRTEDLKYSSNIKCK